MLLVPDSTHIGALFDGVKLFPGILLYVGPDQIMPLTSVLGAIVGIALMFWNRLVGLAHKCRALLSRRPATPQEPPVK